jgi:hypothetical protein
MDLQNILYQTFVTFDKIARHTDGKQTSMKHINDKFIFYKNKI